MTSIFFDPTGVAITLSVAIVVFLGYSILAFSAAVCLANRASELKFRWFDPFIYLFCLFNFATVLPATFVILIARAIKHKMTRGNSI